MVLDTLPFILAGILAQLVDGALGMAFGVLSTTLLLSLGVPPAVASASTHAVETFTTAASALSHMAQRNIDWPLFRRLAVPGMIGGALGAYVLTNIDAGVARPLVLTYLVVIGLVLVYRGWRYPPQLKEPRIVAPLGLAGGFLDASGGGGWGPVVTSNLLIQGASPGRTIGTVNTTEFLVTLVISATFLATAGLAIFNHVVVGLLIGGMLAAPFGAVMAKRVPAKPLLILVGLLLTATSAYGVVTALR